MRLNLILQVALYLIEILHQTTTYNLCRKHPADVVSYRNSTSNHNSRYSDWLETFVVSYRNSTSNHNSPVSGSWCLVLYLIEILHQTTTCSQLLWLFAMLYLIEILHQTTTARVQRSGIHMLYLIEILHQTTTTEIELVLHTRCILSKFYIKPQPCRLCCYPFFVVSYRNSTSNHNAGDGYPVASVVVSYRNSTSNHN